MTVLVDTNILLDVLQRRAPFDVAAAHVWQLSESGAMVGYVSAISFNNVFYIARKQAGNSGRNGRRSRRPRGVSRGAAR